MKQIKKKNGKTTHMKITGACGARRVHVRNRLKGCTCISAGLQSQALHLDVINQPMDSCCAAELGTAEEKVLSGGGRILIASGRAPIGNRCCGWGQLWKQGWPRVPLQQTAVPPVSMRRLAEASAVPSRTARSAILERLR